MPGFYKAEPSETHAYHKDASSDEYYGWASSGTLTSEAHWQIVKIAYTGSNWVEQFLKDTATGLFSDQPIFEWDEVENYSYGILGVS